eukprot:comp22049_c0_seq1/m.50914 comp22049_c0_seq1/g.50914  ORF comp22049_c0_seq1/g.50914 comp22049_c0_seq1/m.50914 type:complete len:311 (-) comp22049_c0_seq1:531-1463(-)
MHNLRNHREIGMLDKNRGLAPHHKQRHDPKHHGKRTIRHPFNMDDPEPLEKIARWRRNPRAPVAVCPVDHLGIVHMLRADHVFEPRDCVHNPLEPRMGAAHKKVRLFDRGMHALKKRQIDRLVIFVDAAAAAAAGPASRARRVPLHIKVARHAHQDHINVRLQRICRWQRADDCAQIVDLVRELAAGILELVVDLAGTVLVVEQLLVAVALVPEAARDLDESVAEEQDEHKEPPDIAHGLQQAEQGGHGESLRENNVQDKDKPDTAGDGIKDKLVSERDLDFRKRGESAALDVFGERRDQQPREREVDPV